MNSDFLLFFRYFNLAFLSFEKIKKGMKKYDLLEIGAVEVFEYRKNNNRY